MKQHLVQHYLYFALINAFFIYIFLSGNSHLHPLEIIFISLLMFGYLLFIWPEAKIKYDDFDNESQKYSYRSKYQKVSLVCSVSLLVFGITSCILFICPTLRYISHGISKFYLGWIYDRDDKNNFEI